MVIAASDLMVSMLAGLIIFPLVFTFGLEPTIGAQLAFSTLPKAFELMPTGQILSVAFFLLIFFAALTSAISMMEVCVAAAIESTRMTRAKVSLILTMLLLLLGLPPALSYSSANLGIFDVRVLDLMDETVGTMGLPITALLIALVFTWFSDRRVLEVQIGATVLRLVLPVAKYVIPGVLIIVTISRLMLSFDFPGWHFLPGIGFIGSKAQGLVTLLVILLLLGLIITARLKRLRK